MQSNDMISRIYQTYGNSQISEEMKEKENSQKLITEARYSKGERRNKYWEQKAEKTGKCKLRENSPKTFRQLLKHQYETEQNAFDRVENLERVKARVPKWQIFGFCIF